MEEDGSEIGQREELRRESVPRRAFITGSYGAGTALGIFLNWGERPGPLYSGISPLLDEGCLWKIWPRERQFCFIFSVEAIPKRGLATEGHLSETEEPILYSHRGVWVMHQHYWVHENLTCDNANVMNRWISQQIVWRMISSKIFTPYYVQNKHKMDYKVKYKK